MRVVAKTSSTTDSSICDHPPRPSRSQDYQRVGQISIATCAYHSLPPWLNLISTCSLPAGLRHPWQALPPSKYPQALVVGESACWSVLGYILVLCDMWCVMCDWLKWDEGLLWFPHTPCDCFCPDDEQFANETMFEAQSLATGLFKGLVDSRSLTLNSVLETRLISSW